LTHKIRLTHQQPVTLASHHQQPGREKSAPPNKILATPMPDEFLVIILSFFVTNKRVHYEYITATWCLKDYI